MTFGAPDYPFNSVGPLAGIRVLELATLISGPLCSGILCDQGADVIKVEPVDRPDVSRMVGPKRGSGGAFFHLLNRGKRGLSLDLKSPAGREIFLRLAASSDVVVQNWRPGVGERLGVSYEQCAAVAPDIIYLSISGFGGEGPYSKIRAYDTVIQAATGMASVQGGEGQRPQLIRNMVCDKIAAWMGAQAVTGALVARGRGGGGRHIKLSMFDAALSFLWTDAATRYTLSGEDIESHASHVRAEYLTRHSDGWSVVIPTSDEEFRAICRIYGRPDVADDPRFSTQAGRLTDSGFPAIYQEVLEGAIKLTVADALSRLKAAGVEGVPVVPLAQIPQDPQVRASGILREREDAKLGRIVEPRLAAEFVGSGVREGSSAPRHGEHNDQVLDLLGYSSAEIADLRSTGTLGQ